MTGYVALLVVLGLSVAIAAYCHATIRSFFGASFGAALISTVLFQGAAYHEVGYLDPFFPIGLVFGAFYAFLISLPVGFVTRHIRARRPPTPAHDTSRRLP